MPSMELGEAIPADTAHVCHPGCSSKHAPSSQYEKHQANLGDQAVSVSLPTWKSNVGYEEGEEWVVSKMATGYPRYVFLEALFCSISIICLAD